MSEYRDPKTSKRTAVLRGEKPELVLQRLAEWNDLLDKAESALDRGLDEEHCDKEMAANDLWKTMKREQGFRFVGWLLEDPKLTSGGPGAPGDLHVGELEFEKDWRR